MTSRLRGSFRSEIIMGLLIVLVLGLLIHPYFMPMGLVLLLVGALGVLIFGLGIFIWQESPRDEREQQVGNQSGRIAFMAGGLVLTVGIAAQTIGHKVDPWIVLALAAMVLSKIGNNYRNR